METRIMANQGRTGTLDPHCDRVEKATRQLPEVKAELAPFEIEVMDDPFIEKPPLAPQERRSVRWTFRRFGSPFAWYWPGSLTVDFQSGRTGKASLKRVV